MAEEKTRRLNPQAQEQEPAKGEESPQERQGNPVPGQPGQAIRGQTREPQEQHRAGGTSGSLRRQEEQRGEKKKEEERRQQEETATRQR